MPDPRPEVIEVLEAHKFHRFIVSTTHMPPQAIGPDGKKTCTWCGGPLPPRRRRWCSDECGGEMAIRSSSSTAAYRVWERDQGVCAGCGIDTKVVWALWEQCRSKRYYHNLGRGPHGVRQWMPEGWMDQWGPWVNLNTYQMWEADHIIPVSEGGGCCGLDNYQTLCLKCHKEDTAALAKRKAEKRKDGLLGPRIL